MKKSNFNKLVALMPLLLVCNFINAQWFTGGNFVVPGQFLGSTNTMPLDIHTDNAFRLRVNPIGTSTINTSVVNTTGFVGINTSQPWAFLHVNGPNNVLPWVGNGYRNWMRTGTYYSENSDNLYTGLKEMGENRSDAVWLWGDDSQGAPTNYSRFVFSGAANGSGTCTDCPTVNTGLDGREVMRLAPNGNVGVGPLFETNLGGINSNIHNHMEGILPVWFQQSNKDGTGGTATDGLRMGIDDTGRAYLKNQENQPLIFSTDNNTTNQLGNERVRITHVNNNETLNPFILPQDLTRIGVSLNSSLPVNDPRSLIHMGSNVTGGTAQSAEGWRFWMNNGIYMREKSDNIYVGTKREGDNQDRADAIVAFGSSVEEGAESNLRFIFASPFDDGVDPISESLDGREVGRFAPDGNFGIGNFYTNGLDEQPTQRLDVDGTARLRNMPENEPHVLITGRMQDIDPTSGDYVLNHLDFSNDPNQFLNGQGDWVNGTNVCDWNISGQDLTMGWTGSPNACHTGYVGIGRQTPQRKLDVLVGDLSNTLNGNSDFAAIRGVNSFPTTSTSRNAGVMGVSAELNPAGNISTNIGGYFAGTNASHNINPTSNYGVVAVANATIGEYHYYDWNQSTFSYGVRSDAENAKYVYGIYSSGRYGEVSNIGALGVASRPYDGAYNVGLYGAAYGGGADIDENIGTLGYASGGILTMEFMAMPL